MARSRSIIIAGAGIGGLTAALAIARAGFRVVVLEQASRLEETGAGLQLSPNATRVLFGLGLADRLRPHAVAPEAISIHSARSGDEVVRVPLGAAAEARYGAPYWVMHRADLQAALAAAVKAVPDIEVRLGARVEDFAVHANGVTVEARTAAGQIDERGAALIGADGLWSRLRACLGDTAPLFARRTAWRALVPADQVTEEFRAPVTHLWLGPKAHLVHYPVQAGRAINVVAIVSDRWQEPGWSASGAREQLLHRFSAFAPWARALLALPDRWLKWALFDRAPVRSWGRGPVTLLGDAAHPMLPFLAQGGAMAIEDAAVLARCLEDHPDDPATAMRTYEGQRRRRTARAQREARRNGQRYHLIGPLAFARNKVLHAMGGESLRARYDWLYDWRL